MAEITTERDLVVALSERVIGWGPILPYRENIGQQYTLPKPLYLADEEVPGIFIRTSNSSFAKTWNPLESIADAWMVVEAMRDKHLWAAQLTAGRVAGWQCGFSYQRGREPRCEFADADTAPRAICFAAAAAVCLGVRLG